jgi:DNA-binding IclR family transcriptional regulator
VLRCFSAAQPQLGVSEVARRVGLHKSSVSRILATLEEAGMVEQDAATGRFRLGLGLVALAAPILSDLNVAKAATPHLEELAARTGDTVSFNIWDGTDAVTIAQARGLNEVAHYAPSGLRNPPHCTAAGKALLAHAPTDVVNRLLKSPLEGFTARTIADPAALLEELERVRRQGYALNRGEFAPDVGAVAAIVRDIDGDIAGAIAVTVPMYRFDAQRQAQLASLVVQAANRLAQRLGFSGEALGDLRPLAKHALAAR